MLWAQPLNACGVCNGNWISKHAPAFSYLVLYSTFMCTRVALLKCKHFYRVHIGKYDFQFNLTGVCVRSCCFVAPFRKKEMNNYIYLIQFCITDFIRFLKMLLLPHLYSFLLSVKAINLNLIKTKFRIQYFSVYTYIF